MNNVVDPNPKVSEGFGQIQIRKKSSDSDPDTGKINSDKSEVN
jgi:hypothetical protein